MLLVTHASTSILKSNDYSSNERDYSYYAERSKDKYNRRCIDGSITGCGNCVGYCQYAEHRGFLTEKQRHEHNCLGKSCFYYLPKTKQKNNVSKRTSKASAIIDAISEALSEYEGLKAMHSAKNPDGGWLVKYVTITNSYSIPAIEKNLSSILGETITMIKLNYDFDTAVKLIFS